MKHLAMAVLSCVLLSSSLSKAANPAEPATQPSAAVPDQATLEKGFAELLTNAVMVGNFNAGSDKAPHEDRYTILKAVKGAGEDWVITARVEYKGIGLPMDFAVPVKWAGDTPVISVTNQSFPGMGTFSARVMFYGKQYAGTWSHGDKGGLMWGRIEKADAVNATTRPSTRPAK